MGDSNSQHEDRPFDEKNDKKSKPFYSKVGPGFNK